MDMDLVGSGISAFAARLHRVAARPGANFTASPLSIALALGMLRAGARGTTGSQIDAVLGLPPGTAPGGSAHATLAALARGLVTVAPMPIVAVAPMPIVAVAPMPIVAVANALFVDDGFAAAVQPAFTDLLAQTYGARITSLHFDDPGAAAAINAWVDAETRGRIDRLFDSLGAGTRLVLANAVYLKATWQAQFDRPTTVPGDFTVAPGTTVQAQLMRHRFEGVRYAETADWQRITLPYVGGTLAMHVALPRTVRTEVDALADLLPVATASTASDQPAWVALTLPRWDTHSDLDLVRVLARLGMTDAFDGRKADLSGIAPGLVVGDAVHRANITVDEEGTEAAAVTGLAMRMALRAGEPVPMRADRPFVWAVVHEPTGTPVFVGHVADPSGDVR
ncbi:MAG TPA: serpin family protein [Actinomycetes bacterium]